MYVWIQRKNLNFLIFIYVVKLFEKGVEIKLLFGYCFGKIFGFLYEK